VIDHLVTNITSNLSNRRGSPALRSFLLFANLYRMSAVIFLADDKSPLIHYDSGWAPATAQENSLADQSVVLSRLSLRSMNDKFLSDTFAAHIRRVK